VYIVPLRGAPRRNHSKSPSYWHGGSPDGKTWRSGRREELDFDIYAFPAGRAVEETQLRTPKGLDDGPEYSPDGKYISSLRTHRSRCTIWGGACRWKRAEQINFWRRHDWFFRTSRRTGTDGVRHVLTLSVEGHPREKNKDVMLRHVTLKYKTVTVLPKLFRGGQGTMNVPSWSPDGKQFAFVSNQLWCRRSRGQGHVP